MNGTVDEPPTAPTLADVVACANRLWDPRTVESWDAVGLVCGDPDAPVRRVLFAVDPVEAVVDEVVGTRAGTDVGSAYDLLVTHHPLFLRGTSSVAETTPKGRVVARLIRAGAGLLVAHTNADAADPGVSDSLARAVGLLGALRPLAPRPAAEFDGLATYVPVADAERLLDALSAAGAGRVGDYARAAYLSEGTGTFLPLAGATPAIGTVGEVERVRETRLELVLPRGRRQAVVTALREAHPYEEPAFRLVELADLPGSTGLGRVGELPEPEPLRAFTARVARALPGTAWGVRAAGNPDRLVQTVAVCGGSGDSLLRAATAAGVDAYVTADLRHHPASEHDVVRGPALVDAAHWATEAPWLRDAARALRDALAESGAAVETAVSVTCTDPWTLHEHQPPPGAAGSAEGGIPA